MGTVEPCHTQMSSMGENCIIVGCVIGRRALYRGVQCCTELCHKIVELHLGGRNNKQVVLPSVGCTEVPLEVKCALYIY